MRFKKNWPLLQSYREAIIVSLMPFFIIFYIYYKVDWFFIASAVFGPIATFGIMYYCVKDQGIKYFESQQTYKEFCMPKRFMGYFLGMTSIFSWFILGVQISA